MKYIFPTQPQPSSRQKIISKLSTATIILTNLQIRSIICNWGFIRAGFYSRIIRWLFGYDDESDYRWCAKKVGGWQWSQHCWHTQGMGHTDSYIAIALAQLLYYTMRSLLWYVNTCIVYIRSVTSSLVGG